MDDKDGENKKNNGFETNSVIIVIHCLSPSLIFEEDNNMNHRFVQIFKVYDIRFAFKNIYLVVMIKAYT